MNDTVCADGGELLHLRNYQLLCAVVGNRLWPICVDMLARNWIERTYDKWASK